MGNQKEAFEKIERVKSILNKYDWFFDLMNNQYVLESHQGDMKCAMASNYLDGMWFMWQQEQKVAVPDGFKILPIEPTEDMIENGLNCEHNIDDWVVIAEIYKAMIEAQEN